MSARYAPRRAAVVFQNLRDAAKCFRAFVTRFERKGERGVNRPRRRDHRLPQPRRSPSSRASDASGAVCRRIAAHTGSISNAGNDFVK